MNVRKKYFKDDCDYNKKISMEQIERGFHTKLKQKARWITADSLVARRARVPASRVNERLDTC
jgi:hypothetical protein